MSYVDLDITKEVKDKGINVFAKGDNDNNANTCFIKRSRLSTISCNYLAFDNNVSVSKL
jgi:hypothetical protein